MFERLDISLCDLKWKVNNPDKQSDLENSFKNVRCRSEGSMQRMKAKILGTETESVEEELDDRFFLS